MHAATEAQSTTLRSTFRYKLIALIGPDHVHAASPVDVVARVEPKVIVAPGNESELAEVLSLSNEADLAVSIRPDHFSPVIYRHTNGRGAPGAGPGDQ